MRSKIPLFISLLSLAILPGTALCHLVSTRFGEFYSGLLHPTTSLVHLVPWLTLGFLAAFQPLAQARTLLILFPLAVACGAILADWLGTFALVEYINLASILVLGACVVWAKELPNYLLRGLTILFGLTHGNANANIDLSGNGAILYLAGIMVAAYLSVCLTSAGGISIVNRYQWGKTAVRAAGSWVLAVGIIFSGFTLLNISA